MLAVGGALIMKGMDDSHSGGGGGGGRGGEDEVMSNWGLFVVTLGAFTSAVYFIIQKPTLVGESGAAIPLPPGTPYSCIITSPRSSRRKESKSDDFTGLSAAPASLTSTAEKTSRSRTRT